MVRVKHGLDPGTLFCVTYEKLESNCEASFMSEWDWTSSYKEFDKLALDLVDKSGDVDLDPISRLKAENDYHGSKDPFMGHYHDHHEERVFFEKPEVEKMAYCERHRVYGNALYQEGMIPKAAEQYKLSLSYYEYCFPATEDEQDSIDELKNVCLCNISLCYFRMNNYRDAIQAATQILQKHPNHVKALYRRARVYRELDEYENAHRDITLAIAIDKEDVLLVEEIEALRQQQRSSLHTEKVFAKKALGEKARVGAEREDKYPENKHREKVIASIFEHSLPIEPNTVM